MRVDSGCLSITTGDLLREILGTLFAHEIDRASAEPPSGHASTEETGQAFGRFDHGVEFPAADFVEISQAVVRLAHRSPYSGQILLGERKRSIERSLVLADDMGTPFRDRNRKVEQVLIQQFDRYIAQRSNRRIPFREIAYTFFTFFPTRVVSPGRKVVLDHCVADHEADTSRDGNKLKFQRAAIEKKSVPHFSHAGDELVHNSYACADEIVLRLLAELGDLRQRQLRLVQAHQSKRRGNLKRGG